MISCPKSTPIHYARTDPDVVFMLRVRDGDAEAFRQLMVRYEQRVRAIVCRAMGESAEVEDLAQDVFLRVFRARANYVPNAKFSTWLFTIVNNVIRNALRDRARRREVNLREPCEGYSWRVTCGVAARDCSHPFARLQHDELRTAVLAAVDQLSERQRAVTRLCGLEGLTHAHAAETLHTTPVAVKALLGRARGKLREWLTPYVEDGMHGARGYSGGDTDCPT